MEQNTQQTTDAAKSIGSLTLNMLERALALDPSLPEAHSGLGALLADSLDPLAVESFERAARLRPTSGELYNVGWAWAQRHRCAAVNTLTRTL